MQRTEPGVVQELGPGLRCILAPNPGPMTHWGTNTFLIGDRDIAVIDPGPDAPGHCDAILAATRHARVTHIMVTHAHLDHSPLASVLSERTGAPVLGFGPAEAGRSAIMQNLALSDMVGGGEGVDHAFSPNKLLADGDHIHTSEWSIEVLHTPGHFAGHISFKWSDILFSGDHVMDWASSLVSPPDGDLGQFMATSRRLKDLSNVTFYPAHGGILTDPSARLEWLISHRLARETAILNALGVRGQTIPEITAKVYSDVPKPMLAAAERNVFAHLIDCVSRGLVVASPALGIGATYRLAS